MKVEYNAQTNAAYISLVPIRRTDMVSRTHSVAGEGIMLDFSNDGTLVGLEVLNAFTRLPACLLGEALLESADSQRKQSVIKPTAPRAAT